MVGKVHKTTELQRFFSQNQNQKEKHFQNSLLDEIVISWWRKEMRRVISFYFKGTYDKIPHKMIHYISVISVQSSNLYIDSFRFNADQQKRLRYDEPRRKFDTAVRGGLSSQWGNSPHRQHWQDGWGMSPSSLIGFGYDTKEQMSTEIINLRPILFNTFQICF